MRSPSSPRDDANASPRGPGVQGSPGAGRLCTFHRFMRSLVVRPLLDDVTALRTRCPQRAAQLPPVADGMPATPVERGTTFWAIEADRQHTGERHADLAVGGPAHPKKLTPTNDAARPAG